MSAFDSHWEGCAVMLDPRWEWENVSTVTGDEQWVKIRCRHIELLPVRDVAEALVAFLCQTCGRQLSVEQAAGVAGRDRE